MFGAEREVLPWPLEGLTAKCEVRGGGQLEPNAHSQKAEFLFERIEWQCISANGSSSCYESGVVRHNILRETRATTTVFKG